MGCCASAEQRVERPLIARKRNKNAKIIIVGAGPAGIHMASLLINAGFKNVTILERSNRIGGKSRTIFSPKTKDVPHEMGTCYLHPECEEIRALLRKYDPRNSEVAMGSRSIGTFLTEEFEESDMKPVNLTKWALAEAEKMVLPKAIRRFVPDIVSGGLGVVVAVKKYVEIHREIFGEVHEHGFLAKPKNLESINMTFLEFIQKHNLQTLIPFFVYSHVMQGYGVLQTIPAFYGLFWNRPAILEKLIDIFRSDKALVTCLSNGFHSLWSAIAAKDNITIIRNAHILSVNRHMKEDGAGAKGKGYDDDDQKTEIQYQIHAETEYNGTGYAPLDADDDEKDENTVISCDLLFIACDCQQALDFLSDATEDEKAVFGKLETHTFCTTLYESALEPKEAAAELFPAIASQANGGFHGHRNSAKVIRAERVENGEFKTDESVAYQFFDRDPKRSDAEECSKILKKDLALRGEKEVAVVKQCLFRYFPHFGQNAINKGYPWKIRDEMQGNNNGNTFYIGSSVCFESVLDVVEYNLSIQQRYGFK